MDEKALSLPDAVINAYESSKNMLVVTNEYDDSIDFQMLFKQFQYSDGSTLKKHVPEELYQKASKIISDNLGSRWVGTYEQYNPIYWTMLIRNTYLADFSFKKSINEYFITKAKQDGKLISSVESLESYYKYYIDLPEEVQIFKLKQITDISWDDCLKQTRNFYEAWAAGASGYIEKTIYNTDGYAKDELPLIAQYNKLFYEAVSKEIAERAEEYLSTETSVFACINIEYLVGEKGVVVLLTKAGCDVEKVKTHS